MLIQIPIERRPTHDFIIDHIRSRFKTLLVQMTTITESPNLVMSYATEVDGYLYGLFVAGAITMEEFDSFDYAIGLMKLEYVCEVY